ncbi:MAG: DUF3299 domain-containing protein, partial [Gammaproteobacteria bacterium]|nr:DUF3299 domain-containing protein [Gammaproteobacteria bacterium]
QALMEEPDPSTILEGSSADSLTSHLSIKIDDPVTAYERALISFEVKKDFDNQNIKIPGYIVPVNTSEDGKIISFFLVPFFGACLHLPPPPPNQIIFVTSVKGIKIEDINEAYWIEGTITTKSRYDDVANSAYSMVMNDFYMFKEGDSY